MAKLLSKSHALISTADEAPDGGTGEEAEAAKEASLAYVLIIRDTHQHRFGGFICGTSLGRSGDRYQGSSDTAVFRLHTAVAGEEQQQQVNMVNYFAASKKNPYYILSSRNMLAMGGGGNFALYLDGELSSGISGECSTFNSPILCYSAESFLVDDCELFMLI
jgi:hypothetical protein